VYSFAISVLGVINVFISSISSVAFPYLSNSTAHIQKRFYPIGESLIILLWGSALGFYFPLSGLISIYFSQYTSSLSLVQVLLCSLSFGSIIQILHINYYKLNQKQSQYFLTAIGSVALTIGLIQITLYFWRNLVGVAIATVLGFTFWYGINELLLHKLMDQKWSSIAKRFIGIVLFTGAFMFSSWVIRNHVIQWVVYYVLVIAISMTIFNNEIKMMIDRLFNRNQ
jgi:O-antigen/teichoic acid export membrane protein